VGVVNARFVKPLDRALLLSHAACIPLLVTMEDHVLAGGFGSAVLEALQDADCPTAVERIGWPDKFIEHGTSSEVLRASYGLSPDDIHRRVLARWRNLREEHVAADV
jgi:1-deoxy-D-xylulose-5-phosphate synthase